MPLRRRVESFPGCRNSNPVTHLSMGSLSRTSCHRFGIGLIFVVELAGSHLRKFSKFSNQRALIRKLRTTIRIRVTIFIVFSRVRHNHLEARQKPWSTSITQIFSPSRPVRPVFEKFLRILRNFWSWKFFVLFKWNPKTTDNRNETSKTSPSFCTKNHQDPLNSPGERVVWTCIGGSKKHPKNKNA